MGRKKLCTLSKASGGRVDLPHGTGYTPQSLAFVNDNKRFVICSGGKGNRIVKATSSGYKKTGHTIHTGHANGGCYCTKDGLVYCSTYSGSATKSISVWDPDGWKWKRNINIGVYCTGLAFDPITENFYVSAGDKWSVFSYENFTKKKGTRKHKTYSKKHGRVGYWQDAGGYGGIAMFCTSHQIDPNKTSYIDCYRAADGKYMGSLKTKGEVESVAVGSDGHFHVLYAGNKPRQITKMKQTMKSVGLYSGSGTSTGGVSPGSRQVITAQAQGNKVVKQARTHVGEGGSKAWNYANNGKADNWCAMFVRMVFHECKYDKLMATINYVPVDFTNQIIKKGGKIIWASGKKTSSGGPNKQGSRKKCLPGDICLYSGHVNILAKNDNGTFTTIGGNEGSYNLRASKVKEQNRQDQYWVVRPGYKDTAVNEDGELVDGEVAGEGSGTLEVHPDKLYSSDNFEYANIELDSESKTAADIKDTLNKILSKDGWQNFDNPPGDSEGNVAAVVSGTAAYDSRKGEKTKVSGEAHGNNFPIALDPVEAPFVELTIGGYTFGMKTEEEKYPNYISGIDIKKTNASMNEYTINLTHQVSAGRNPNFIDELIARNGYSKIKIKYGDANADSVFVDENAILAGVSIGFDFASCNITYSIKATSSVLGTVSKKQTYSGIIDKGSNIISNLLSSGQSALIEAFPKMKDKTYVAKNNLLPTSDAIINMKAMTNVSELTYLKNVVASMKSAVDDTASYYLAFGQDYFTIKEVSSRTMATDASIYEVDINYPDENQVFSFTDDIDFAWPLAYEFNGDVNNYTYSMADNGKIQTYSSPFANGGSATMANNWWKQVTEFPATAKLTCRGLLSPLLLLTYVKVNSWYYGSQRLTSGVYIVTAQEDKLDSNGFRTTLSLTKVAGPEQHLTVDARVKT